MLEEIVKIVETLDENELRIVYSMLLGLTT